MRLIDIAKMAISNLRRRPGRSLLNLLGITLGATTIMMTAAGSNGVKKSLHSLLETSEFTRKVMVNFESMVKESDLDESDWQIDADIDSERKERLEEAMKRHLLGAKRRKLGRWRMIDPEALKKFEGIEHALDIVPTVRLSFDFAHGQFNQTASGSGISPNAFGLPDRIIAGEMIGDDDLDQVLIHELLAYQMGYVTQEQLDSLIGSEITAVFAPDRQENEISKLLKDLESGNVAALLEEKSELLSTVQALVGDADLQSLSNTQKRLIRSSLKSMVPESTEEPVNIERTFTIKGVYHNIGDTDLFSVFKRFSFDPIQPVLFHFKTATQLQLGTRGKKYFHSTTIYVDSFKSLQPVEDEVQQLGYRTSSARDMLAQIDQRIDDISKVIYFIALSVLIITAIAISNALIVSVAERTQEFGIIKSLGARTKHIVWLMFIEGALLGAAGAALAVLLSVAIGKLGQGYLRQYIEGRVNQSISGDLLSFSPLWIVTAILSAMIVCSLASVIPAWRAAQLDPVVAMRKN